MTTVTQSRDGFERSLIELECFVQTLNAPEDAPPFAFVMDCMVDRLRLQWEQLLPLIDGGMGVMTPMDTNPVEPSIDLRGRGICELHDESARPD